MQDKRRCERLFLVIALIAAFFGFVPLAGMAYDAAKLLFFVFLVLFLASLLVGLLTGRRPPGPVV